MKDKDVLKLLIKNGWKLERISGSHHILVKDGMTEVIPIHNKDMKPDLLNAILKRTGIK